MNTKSLYSIFFACLTLAFGFLAGSYHSRWKQGVVIAGADSGRFKIRQIPTHAPGLNDSYAYRCEIWSDGVLEMATTLAYADFAASPGKCRIEIPSPFGVVFDVDGYKIECTYSGIGSDRPANTLWKQLGQ
jgi:hypothetical protein